MCSCKIIKFWDINFKILSHILATPKIISKIHGEDNIQYCAWCGHDATLEHILLQCPDSKYLHTFVCTTIKASSFSDDIGSLVIQMLNSTPSFGLPTFVFTSVILWPARAPSWKYKLSLLMSVINMLLFTLFLTAFCRMETTRILLHIESVQHFNLDSALSVTKRMLPDRCFETTPTMCEALAHVFNMSEGDLHLLVCDIFS